MEKEFISYTEALALKELGFNQPCFGYYTGDKKHLLIRPNMGRRNEDLNDVVCTAPLYQQAFRFFREKYNIHAEITWSPSYEYEPEKWSDAIYEITFVNVSYTKEWEAESPDMQRGNGKQLTYEEAELECLKKLIEICKK